jgi:hypothetical protein
MRIIYFSVVVAMTVLFLGAGDSPSAHLASPQLNARLLAANSIRASRQEIVKQLIEIVSTSKDPAWNGPKQLAIELLGELRDPAAIPVLLDNFTFVPSGEIVSTDARETQSYYVAAMALGSIGTPSINPLIARKIQESKSKEDRDLAVWTVMRIEGNEQALSRFQRMAVARQHDPETRQLFTEAAKYITDFKPTFGPPKTPGL